MLTHKTSWLQPPLVFPTSHASRGQFLPIAKARGILALHFDEFKEWWDTLTEAAQDSISAVVTLLERKGAMLSFPYSSAISRSRHSHMRELRIQHQGKPIRIFYAFDSRRHAILLIGGDKTGKDRFYEEYVSIADFLYDKYLEELKKEGLI